MPFLPVHIILTYDIAKIYFILVQYEINPFHPCLCLLKELLLISPKILLRLSPLVLIGL